MFFSVLMSVYYKEQPEYLKSSLQSLVGQTLPPGEVVLVEDGPIPESLSNVIKEYSELLPIVSVKLSKNSGLAIALNEGLEHCKGELIVRMDSDDISVEKRCEIQVGFMEAHPEIAVSSGTIEEWDEKLRNRIDYRILPTLHKDILSFAKYRSPISHPACVFRKSVVLSEGGYPVVYPEDYMLWVKLLHKGYQFANVADVLLKMRTGDDFVSRRGAAFLAGELRIFKYMYGIGFIRLDQYLMNVLMRAVVRLSPARIKKVFYKLARR